MSNGSLDILKSPRVCHVLEFVKLRKSHCNQCKFGIFFQMMHFLWPRVHGIVSLGISLILQCSKVTGFVAYCYQEHRQNEIHYKVHLSTLFPKRHATFHGAFLLRLSVLLYAKHYHLDCHLFPPASVVECIKSVPSVSVCYIT